jgi:hypothetical protein
MLASSTPWLLLSPLTSGLQFSALLWVQAAAVAATVGTDSLRCALADAACPEAGARYQELASLLSVLSSPFVPPTVRLRPRAACWAAMSLLQITVG